MENEDFKILIKEGIKLYIYKDGRIFRPSYLRPNGKRMGDKWLKFSKGNNYINLNGTRYNCKHLITEAFNPNFNKISHDENSNEIKILIKRGITLHVFKDGRIFKDGHIRSDGRSLPSKWFKYKKDINEYVSINLKGKPILVHRIIAEAFLRDYSEELEVDHINGIKYDNRVENLRMVTKQDNAKSYRNQKKIYSSQYRGVIWHKLASKWSVNITNNGKQKYIGLFHNEKLAAYAYDLATLFFGFNKESMNFPEYFDKYIKIFDDIDNYKDIKNAVVLEKFGQL